MKDIIDVEKTLNNMKQLIHRDIEKIIEAIKVEYNNKINRFESTFFDELFFFNHVISNEKDSDFYNASIGKRAVYIFIMKNDIDFPEGFNNVPYGATINDIKVNKINKSEVLYLGKTKSIITRIKNHFSNEKTSPNSLKLNCKPRDLLLDSFKIYAFTLKNKYKSTKRNKNMYENMILSNVEDFLHNKLEPKVGISRV